MRFETPLAQVRVRARRRAAPDRARRGELATSWRRAPGPTARVEAWLDWADALPEDYPGGDLPSALRPKLRPTHCWPAARSATPAASPPGAWALGLSRTAPTPKRSPTALFGLFASGLAAPGSALAFGVRCILWSTTPPGRRHALLRRLDAPGAWNRAPAMSLVTPGAWRRWSTPCAAARATPRPAPTGRKPGAGPRGPAAREAGAGDAEIADAIALGRIGEEMPPAPSTGDPRWPTGWPWPPAPQRQPGRAGGWSSGAASPSPSTSRTLWRLNASRLRRAPPSTSRALPTTRTWSPLSACGRGARHRGLGRLLRDRGGRSSPTRPPASRPGARGPRRAPGRRGVGLWFAGRTIPRRRAPGPGRGGRSGPRRSWPAAWAHTCSSTANGKANSVIWTVASASPALCRRVRPPADRARSWSRPTAWPAPAGCATPRLRAPPMTRKWRCGSAACPWTPRPGADPPAPPRPPTA